ncbi:MAG: hypothetical protein N2512_07095 [Armatimonadetes bacterium]|nr:hypothetical protein [Armatimonadota bacterium]
MNCPRCGRPITGPGILCPDCLAAEALGAEELPAERFPTVAAGLRRALQVITAATWVLFGMFVTIEARAPGGLGRLLTLNGLRPAEAADVVYLALVFGAALAILLLAMRLSRRQVVVSDESLALEDHGRVVWAIPWDDLAAWQREASLQGTLVAITLHDKSGRAHRVNLYALSEDDYEPLIAEIRRRAPVGSEQPESGFVRCNCVTCLLVVVFAVLIAIAIAVWLWYLPR